MLGSDFEAMDAAVKAEAYLRLRDVLVAMLVFDSVVLEDRDGLFDDACPHNGAWDFLRAPVPAL